MEVCVGGEEMNVKKSVSVRVCAWNEEGKDERIGGGKMGC